MFQFHRIENTVIAELTDRQFIISNAQDVLDLMGDLIMDNCNRMIIYENTLHADFFKLHTGLAGEILQKFSNYNFKLALVGDFAKYQSKSLQDLIRESNKGNRIFFCKSLEIAICKLTEK
jgi:hypothetical protein